jgi:alpha-L-fucosidase
LTHRLNESDPDEMVCANGTWGYKRDDNNWKSTETLLRNLVDIASKGGNYLLNVGPTSEGLIPAPSVERLKAVGQWMKVNGEAIYGTGPTPFGAEAGSVSDAEKDKKGKPLFKPAWVWRCTTKPGKLYLHLFRWPAGEFQLPGLQSKVTRAWLLADPAHQPLKTRQTGQGVTLFLPAGAAPDPIASVVVAEIADPVAKVARP